MTVAFVRVLHAVAENTMQTTKAAEIVLLFMVIPHIMIVSQKLTQSLYLNKREGNIIRCIIMFSKSVR